MKKLLVFLTIVVVFMGLLVFSIMVEDKNPAAPQVSVNEPLADNKE